MAVDEPVEDVLRRLPGVFVALRPRSGELTETVAVAAARSVMADIIPPDQRARPAPGLPGPRWEILSRERARAVFAYTLGHDLVWDEVEVDEPTVRAVTDRFFGRFSDAAYFLTAGVYTDDGRLRGWNPLTMYTMEAGIVAVDERTVGAFWKVGED